mmetsp:Transcript_17216/g.37703  ORF Transcript_17216/g.37703 Transcript_17216/m.37703 type:complete len:83 (+) Transcript_17216:771-1019(+)
MRASARRCQMVASQWCALKCIRLSPCWSCQEGLPREAKDQDEQGRGRGDGTPRESRAPPAARHGATNTGHDRGSGTRALALT